MLSCFSRVQLFSTLWTVACQVPLSLRFSRQESWSGLPCPSPGIFPTWDQTGICLHLLHCRQILYPLSYLGSPLSYYSYHYKVKKKKKQNRKIMSLDKSPGNLLGHSDSPQLSVSRAVLQNLSVVKDHRRFYKI